jgi:programmed cell death protein 5
MDHFTPSHVVNPNEVPEGFTTTDPNNNHAAANKSTGVDLQKEALQEQKQMILEQAMDSDALARLGRIKMVKPEKAVAVENSIVSMAMQGKLPGPITEGKLIEILERGGGGGSRRLGGGSQTSNSINIQRKKYSLDSDEEDDNDDDV